MKRSELYCLGLFLTVVVVAQVLMLVQTFSIFCPFFFPTGKHIFNFDGEILLRMKFLCFLKWKASFLGNGNKGKNVKRGITSVFIFLFLYLSP